MAFEIVGIDNSVKVPGFYGEASFASGTLSADSAPLLLLLVGMRTTQGNLTLDSEVREVQSEALAITAAGRGSQLHRMYRAALKANPLARIFLAAVTEPGAGTAATATGVITGTPGNGTAYFYCAGETITVACTSSDTIDTFGQRVADTFTAKPDLPFTCAYNSGTDTLTWTHRHKGTQGKDQVILLDQRELNGLSLALTGSSALSGNGLVGVKMGASATGTGAEDVTTLLASAGMTVKRYARIGSAQNDTTNAALWETFVNTQAGPTKLMVEQVVFGSIGSQGTVTALSQTTLNAPRASVIAARNYEVHPSEIAAYTAALRTAVEGTGGDIGSGTGPVPDYNGKILGGLPPQRIEADRWSWVEQNALLNAGATPLDTVADTLRIVRYVCSYCSDGTAQDERCLDIGDPTMTDYAIVDTQLLWASFRAENPGIRDNPAQGEDIAAGIAYPNLWLSTVRQRWRFYVKQGWIEDRFSDTAKQIAESTGDPKYYKPLRAYFNKVAVRIQSALPIVVTRIQSTLLGKVQQTRDLT